MIAVVLSGYFLGNAGICKSFSLYFTAFCVLDMGRSGKDNEITCVKSSQEKPSCSRLDLKKAVEMLQLDVSVEFFIIDFKFREQQ